MMTFSINTILYKMVAIRLELIFLTMTRHAMIFPMKTSQNMRRLMSYFVAHRIIKYTNYFEITNFWRYLAYLIGSRRYVL